MIAQQRLCTAAKKAPRPVLAKARVCALPPFCPSPASLTLSLAILFLCSLRQQ